jgi:hypothetical protein
MQRDADLLNRFWPEAMQITMNKTRARENQYSMRTTRELGHTRPLLVNLHQGLADKFES